jgi:crotonobetainyl-CoA:carnitine CoA-transferase CaiB-like acyl-CoA transferase
MTTLEDLRILDLARTAAGAYCARLFADYGADVIAIEPPAGNPLRRSGDRWPPLSVNKRSITLDICTPSGQRLFRQMVEQANVVVEDFPAGTLDALRLGFDSLYGIKRRIILVSITPGSAAILAGLNAFAATAIAAHNADAYEVPQHITISGDEAASFLAAMGIGLQTVSPDAGLFTMSEVERVSRASPLTGEHNHEFFCGEMGLEPGDLARLRAASVI